MLSGVEVALGAAALVIGLTGAWSPCGFSMVETIGLRGHDGGRRTTLAACAAFAPGTLIGGAITFVALSELGRLAHGAGGRVAYLVAAGIAVAAALLEARGVRIVPQIRRQLPERWRWTMPMPLAAGLYGVLLGLGFTTFVLSFGVWALAGIALALGHPQAGLAIGLAFGAGRALPILFLAPIVDRPLGIRCTALMAGQPALYRSFRFGDALGLGAVAATLAVGAPGTASAAHVAVNDAYDPSAAADTLVFQRADGSGVLRRDGIETDLPGSDPAVGGRYVAVIEFDSRIAILDRDSLAVLTHVAAKSADAVAISSGWLVYRVSRNGRDALRARALDAGGQAGDARTIDGASRPAQLSRPSLDRGALVYALARGNRNAILLRRLNVGGRSSIDRSRTSWLTNPSVHGDHVLYVRTRRKRESPQSIEVPGLVQELVRSRIGGGVERIYARGANGTLWSTALSHDRAYVTLLRSGGGEQILSFAR